MMIRGKTMGMLKRSLLAMGATVAIASLVAGVCAPRTAQAQEIQLTGPLAGAPAVKGLRQYREGRFELAPTMSFTLLDEYRRTGFVGARLQYNIKDWLGVGVWGGYGVLSLTTDLTDQIDAKASRSSTFTQVNVTRGKFEEQTSKLEWIAAPQLQFSPFRGKLALFQNIFADTDLYLHGGLAFVGVKERGECGSAAKPCATNFGLESRMALAPTFGLGLNLYTKSIVSFGVEYRAFPFSWNRAGFDQRGTGPDANFPDQKVNDQDRTFKFNQMITLAVGFSFPNYKVSP